MKQSIINFFKYLWHLLSTQKCFMCDKRYYPDDMRLIDHCMEGGIEVCSWCAKIFFNQENDKANKKTN